MVTSRETLEKIKQIIEKHYAKLTIGLLGKTVFTPEELKRLKADGVDVTNKESFLELVYMHNFINNPRNPETTPTSTEDMEAQQSEQGIKPTGDANEYAVESLNLTTRQYIDKIKGEITTRIQSIIRENNDKYKFNALQNLERDAITDDLVKESSIGRVKQLLRDTAKDGNRDWQRVALTEISNAIGIGSVDRIVTDNRDRDLEEVVVYRVIVQDSVTCKYCRKFYGDVGEIPKLYKLSTLLGNGSNYGKNQQDWSPVVGATHPNTRTSQIIELKPGFKVTPGGAQTYIGLSKWNDWVFEHLKA